MTFIPDRPSELVSGGYDSALLHHDFTQGGLLSRYDISQLICVVDSFILTDRDVSHLTAAGPSTSGVSLAPPFVLSCCITPNALFAASTADGRVWIGGGGEKLPSGSAKTTKKRTRKWEGLSAEDSLWIQVAEGPVVAMYVFRICRGAVTQLDTDVSRSKRIQRCANHHHMHSAWNFDCICSLSEQRQ